MELKYKNIKDVLISIFVGFSIGLSVIVPGISGSAIAMIMKVYDKLMYAFSNIFKKFKLCIVFLIPIIVGIVVGFGLGLILVKILLEAFPFITICFFVGLMIGTYPILFKEIKGEQLKTNKILLFVAGVVIPLIFTGVSMLAGADNSLANINPLHYLLFLVIGVLISLTQLIPGLSATVLLMIFGYYTSLMDNIGFDLLTNFELLMVYISLFVGFVIGTLLFSKIINKLLNTQRKPFFFVICGLSVGSVVSVFLGNDCMEIYRLWTTQLMIRDILIGLAFLLIGFVASFSLYLLDKKREQAPEKDSQSLDK